MVRSIFVVLFFATVVGCTENDGDIISDVGQNEEVNVPKSRYYNDHEMVHARCFDCDRVVSMHAMACPNCGAELVEAKIRALAFDAQIVLDEDGDRGVHSVGIDSYECSDNDMLQLLRLDRRFRQLLPSMGQSSPKSFFEDVTRVRFGSHSRLSDKGIQSMLRILDFDRSSESHTASIKKIESNIDMHLIFWCPVSDVVVRELRHRHYITGLEFWSLPERLTDDLLEVITYTPRLKSLVILQTAVTDEGLSKLDRLKKLEALTVPQGVTNDSLSHLYGLTSLKKLELPKKNFSQIALDTLQDALPDCAISIRD